MDIVYIQGLRIDTVIGVYDWEREIKQTLSFDINMATNNIRAAESDDIHSAVDYKAVSDRIIEFVENFHPQLIETMIERVAQLILTEYSVPWVRIQLSKAGAVPAARDVGVIIERGVKPE